MRNDSSLDDIRAFCTAARVGQFTEAAELLFITPSALSRRIANIESSVGGRVFDRSTCRLRLTAVGSVLYERLTPLLAQLDGTFAEAARRSGEKKGVLVVAMVATVASSFMPQVLEAFYALHPSVYVSIRDGFATSIASLVENGKPNSVSPRTWPSAERSTPAAWATMASTWFAARSTRSFEDESGFDGRSWPACES